MDNASHRDKRLFASIDTQGNGMVLKRDFQKRLESAGFTETDPRLFEVRKRLANLSAKHLTLSTFSDVISPACDLIDKILTGNLAIPQWSNFSEAVSKIFKDIQGAGFVDTGNVASYIPELANQDPNAFGVSFCSVDGQTVNLGNTSELYSVQSTSKPISYLIAMEELGEKEVHRFVGREPSGRNFNELCLNKDMIPHNPMINSGAIMTVSLIKAQQAQAARFRHIINTWRDLTGNGKISFSNTTYLSERASADRNSCLAYMMQEEGSFDQGSDKSLEPRNWGSEDLIKSLELYFQCCSIETNCSLHARAAATLANNGVAPHTRKQIFSGDNVRHALALMLSCGLYDYSGEWAYRIGLPAKSGVSGCLIMVIPKIGGLCVWAPPLDSFGNSVKGVEFCKRLTAMFSMDYFDTRSSKPNPSRHFDTMKHRRLNNLMHACSKGDVSCIRGILAAKADINACDYDGRTALHIACSEGQSDAVKVLVQRGANLEPIDRWGGTPHSDAVRESHEDIAKFVMGRIQKYKVSAKIFKEKRTPNKSLHKISPKVVSFELAS